MLDKRKSYIHAYIHAYVHTYIHTYSKHANIAMNIYKCNHTHTHTHTYTYATHQCNGAGQCSEAMLRVQAGFSIGNEMALPIQRTLLLDCEWCPQQDSTSAPRLAFFRIPRCDLLFAVYVQFVSTGVYIARNICQST